MDKKQGKLIVIEGIDGSGKTTQVNLLSEYLKGKNISFEIINFPRYEDNLYGKLIRRYLSGEFGSIHQVSPYLLALAYAGDRALAKPTMENWLNSGKVVIVNRYVSASKAHLGANLPVDQREEFMRWLDDLEYENNNMPKQDLTILLDVDPAVGQKNIQGGEADLHEDNLKHLEEAARIYLELAQAEPNWKVVNCMENEGMKSKQHLHKLIVEILNSFLVS